VSIPQVAIKKIIIGITNFCNNKCTVCCARSTSNEQDMANRMPSATFHHHAQAAKALGAKLITLSGGEALSHPEIEEFVMIAADLDFEKIRLLSGCWSQEESPTRLATLTKLINDHGTKLQLEVTFSIFRDLGIVEAFKSSWQTTVTDLLSLSDLPNSPITQKGSMVWKSGETNARWPKNRDPYHFLVEIAQKLGGRPVCTDPNVSLESSLWSLYPENVFLSFADKGVMVPLIFFPFIDFGRISKSARETGLHISHRCSHSLDDWGDSIDVKTTGLDSGWLAAPYITHYSTLQPCCSPTNTNPPQGSGIDINPESQVSLETALQKIYSIKGDLAKLRHELYREMERGTSFCQACIEARIQLLSN